MEYECRENQYNKLQGDVVFSLLPNKQKGLYGFQVNLLKEGIKIQYPFRNNPVNYLFIIVNASILLNKLTIETDDLSLFKEKYQSIVHERIFYHHEFLKSETLNRIDYKLDYQCRNQQDKRSLLTILSKARMKRYSASKMNYNDREENPATVYYKANNYRVNTYDKEAEAVSRGNIEEYNINLLRYELQILTGLLNYYEKNYGLKRTVDNYWYMRDYFFNEYLRPIFYIGDYYSNNIISRVLNTSKNKDSLIQKIKEVQQLENVDNVYSYYQLKQLQNLNINPIQNNYNSMNPLNSIFRKVV